MAVGTVDWSKSLNHCSSNKPGDRSDDVFDPVVLVGADEIRTLPGTGTRAWSLCPTVETVVVDRRTIRTGGGAISLHGPVR